MFKNHFTVARMNDVIYGYMGWPSIAKNNGRCYVVCSGFRVGHVCPFGKTTLFYSDNDGAKWSAPVIIDDSPLDDRDAGITVMANGDLFVTNFAHPAAVYENVYFKNIKPDSVVNALMLAQLATYKNLTEEQRHGGSFALVVDSSDFTLKSKVRISVSSPHGAPLCGDKLVYLGKEMYSDGIEESGVIACYESADGVTWTRLGVVPTPEGLSRGNFHEPHVIMLKDGTLLGAIRAQDNGIYHGFSIFLTRSADGGRSWTVPCCIDISGSPPHFMRHSSGAVILSYARREAPASERAVISYDEGVTWSDEIIIDDRQSNADLGYPASVEADNGDIITIYYQREVGDGKTSILGTRWSI